MSRLSKFKEHKVFIELDFMDKVLNSVEEYLPQDLKYIEIYNERVGHQQYSLNLTFYTENWKEIDIDYDFDNDEQEKYGELCLSDFINNALCGMVQNVDVIDWKESIEITDKISPEETYYYEYKK